ncbi:DUF4007 family protein [Desulfococcaceae bacterium HSG7]|nr:DUF4007 family protein [Desulfococcaceae bacterium HSG7]
MARTQADILKDLFIAHRDKNATFYQEKALEFVKYLRKRGFNRQAPEFEAIFFPEKWKKQVQLPFRKSKPEKPKLSPRPRKKPKKAIPVWQVSYGAEINFTQIQRLLEELFQRNQALYSGKKLSDILGYPKKKSWGFAWLFAFAGLLEYASKKPTPLAVLINRYDPYFEDIGTLWFLHYHISSDSNLIIWNRIANHLMTKAHFTYKEVPEHFEEQRKKYSKSTFTTTLRKEFNICMRAYIESEFSKLNLFTRGQKDEFIKTSPTTAPDEILLCAILLYRKKVWPDNVSMEIKNLIHPENSPCRLFYLHEHRFREALERLRMTGFIHIESFADLDQIKFAKTTDYLECLEMYFQKRDLVR